MEPLEAMLLPWAQGVVSSNLAAPTKLSMIAKELIVSLPSVFPVSALFNPVSKLPGSSS